LSDQTTATGKGIGNVRRLWFARSGTSSWHLRTYFALLLASFAVATAVAAGKRLEHRQFAIILIGLTLTLLAALLIYRRVCAAAPAAGRRSPVREHAGRPGADAVLRPG
jgi:hypothetical protein